ncbi:hypothetical protein JG688_00012675 [Phytophthora aleatoria]|uniref:Uncharacterized protein n=1 Tax=Phytophthora aleatoria TaxID=2496075 RepID=A0A8J5IPG8_9STRA|nr:hypothetical protein JG688_00012675 [Phytophthora aleatoria]
MSTQQRKRRRRTSSGYTLGCWRVGNATKIEKTIQEVEPKARRYAQTDLVCNVQLSSQCIATRQYTTRNDFFRGNRAIMGKCATSTVSDSSKRSSSANDIVARFIPASLFGISS